MAHIYLRHPVHGTKIATMDLEADADEQNGWERFDPNNPNDNNDDETLPELAATVNVLAEAPRRRTRTRTASDQ